MEYRVLGWPPDGPRLRLDWRRFAYAGKFVTGRTGAAVARDPGAADEAEGDPGTAADAGTTTPGGGDDASSDVPGAADGPAVATDVVAAVAFSEDRTDPGRLWCRYVTVREDRRGEGVGPRLLAFLAARAADRGYRTVRIAVNNPFAYEAAYRAGFAFTGAETGVAELVCDRPADGVADPDPARYRAGLDRFRDRDLADPERSFLRSRRGAAPPDRVTVPGGGRECVDVDGEDADREDAGGAPE